MKPLASNDMGNKEDFVAHMLRKADKRLQSATRYYEAACATDGDFDDAANRAYYAVFFSILALHTLDGKSFRRHGQAIGEFNKVYLKNNIFDRAYGEAITDLMICRHTSDYDVAQEISQDIMRENLLMAQKIVMDIQAYCFDKYPQVEAAYRKI